jgi:predicted metalloprotease
MGCVRVPLYTVQLPFVDRCEGRAVRLEACGVQVRQIVRNRVLRFLSGSHSLGCHIQSAYHQRALSAQGQAFCR